MSTPPATAYTLTVALLLAARKVDGNLHPPCPQGEDLRAAAALTLGMEEVLVSGTGDADAALAVIEDRIRRARQALQHLERTNPGL